MDDKIDDRVWIPAAGAAALLKENLGLSEHQACESIIRNAASDLVQSRCRRLRWEPYSGQAGARGKQDNCELASAFWLSFTNDGNRLVEHWAVGDFTVYDSSGGHLRTLHAHGVDFEERDVLALVPPGTVRAARIVTPRVAESGRPRWPHWEDVWAEVAARMSRNQLLTKPQARIEEAMTEIAEKFPNPPAISAIRIRAKKLSDALERIVKN